MAIIISATDWLGSASQGFCGETDDHERGDCEIGDLGNLGLWRGAAGRWASATWSVAAAECLALCSACARCTHISLSLQYRDCSWYHKCPKLHQHVQGFRSASARPSSWSGGKIDWKGRAQRRFRGGPTNRTSRKALRMRAPDGTGLAWPWLSPAQLLNQRRTLRLAVVLFGKVGTLVTPSSWVGADRGDRRVVRLARASFLSHVARANPTTSIDVFAHSWNPALEPTIRTVWSPAWLRCEPEVRPLSVVQSFRPIQASSRARA